jgi:hypothetical protein
VDPYPIDTTIDDDSGADLYQENKGGVMENT